MAGWGGSRELQCREDCGAGAGEAGQKRLRPNSGCNGEQHKRTQAWRHGELSVKTRHLQIQKNLWWGENDDLKLRKVYRQKVIH